MLPRRASVHDVPSTEVSIESWLGTFQAYGPRLYSIEPRGVTWPRSTARQLVPLHRLAALPQAPFVIVGNARDGGARAGRAHRGDDEALPRVRCRRQPLAWQAVVRRP